MTRGRFRRTRLTAVLAAMCLAALGVLALPAAQAQQPGERWAADQTLTWTAGDSLTEYASAPQTAVPGEATLVFENSAGTGNTSGMPHTLTFTTSDPEYNDDVDVNIMASPGDENGGRHEVTVQLTPGTYRYHCTIPGHGAMEGELVVSGDGGDDDTTAPEASARFSGEQDDSGAYLGSATVVIDATDDMSGVASVEYALDDGEFKPYEAPVIVREPGEHTVRFRATDEAGNVSEEQEAAFTIIEGDSGDTTPPRVQAAVEGEQDDNGDYLTTATLTLSAEDDASGVAGIDYAVNGGEFTPYTDPVMLHSAGHYSVVYRATDKAGNSSPGREVTFTVTQDPGEGEPEPDCPETDDRPLVTVGDVHAHVPNRTGRDGCTINEVIEDEAAWETAEAFRAHVSDVTAALLRDGILDDADRKAIRDAAAESGIGEGGTAGYEKVLDDTEASFAEWEHVGGGGFERNDDGSVSTSRTAEGMGMLWLPERTFGDFSLRLQFRDDAARGNNANTGVFVRFPGVHGHPDEPRPEWVAIKYGHELQVLDAPGGDQYKTGSVYGFDLVTRDEGMIPPKGTWNDYEIRVVDQHYRVYRSGKLINEFDNAPGQLFSPPRDDDPGTEGRQWDTGHVGLQTHGTSDLASFRDIRVKPL